MAKQPSAILQELADLQSQVGAYQMEHFRQLKQGHVQEKAPNELVTAIDVESERRLKKGLAEMMPKAGFFGEESGKSGDEDAFWIVDPIDGTTNFVCGLDTFCISIAYYEKGQIQLAAIYRPPTGEIYTGSKGQGAFLNGDLLNPSVTVPVPESMVATGFPYRSSEDYRKSFFRCADEVMVGTRGLRRFGSAALDLAFVAAGYFQGFWEADLMPYDVAAGLLLIEETGCQYGQFNGAPYDLFTHKTLVAGIPEVYDYLKGLTSVIYKISESQP